MSFEAWAVFVLFWVVFVTTPGANAANCIQNGMQFGFGRALWGVAAILTQAALFLGLSAVGVTALIAASPKVYFVAQLVGAGLLIWIGVRNWRAAKRPIKAVPVSAHIYVRAFAIATINPKSVAGYLAAFSQFVMPDVPIAEQMWVIVPTALCITAMSYAGYTVLGAWLGRRALSVIAQVAVRRALAGLFILYGVVLGASTLPLRG